MNKKVIRNRKELSAELQRLKEHSYRKEEDIRNSIDGIRNDLRPENLLINALRRTTGIDINRSEFLKNGIAAGLGLVMQRFVFKQEEVLEKKVYAWIDTFFDKVKYYTNKFSSVSSVRSEKIENEN